MQRDATEDPLDDPITRQLANQYEVIRELGRGGMGVVYLAKHKLMDRLQVLKVLNPDMLSRRRTVERFRREIQMAAKLNHPNVVSAYDALEAGGRFVFVMEYVKGGDLAKVVRTDGSLPIASACYFAYQAALGLQHAHERGMVHRDIKPGNLILFREGQRAVVKVLDFGLAKALRESPIDGTLTSNGQMLGTPDYVAPEQILNAQQADIRADIYSLGCTLHYLLIGKPPFHGDSYYDIYQAHISTDAKPLNLVRAEVPAELAALVGKMMAKDLARRYQTPAEVADVLKPFFKAGAARSMTPVPELSSGPSAERIVFERPLPPTEPVTPATAQHDPPGAVAADNSWEGLIDLGTTGKSSLSQDTAHDGRRVRRHLVSPISALLSLALISAITYILIEKNSAPSDKKPALGPSGIPVTARIAQPKPAAATKSNHTADTTETRAPAPTASKGAVPKRGDGSRTPRPINTRRADTRDKLNQVASIAGNSSIQANKGKVPGRLDVRRIRPRPGRLRFSDEDAILPIEPFWPVLTPSDTQAWQLGDPGAMKLNARGLTVVAGSNGNFLLTQKRDYRKCALKLSLEVAQGTEAYLALRVQSVAGTWSAATARITADRGAITAGSQGRDFQTDGTSPGTRTLRLTEPVVITFEDDGKGHRRVLIRGTVTSVLADVEQAEPDTGAVGLFVKSGTIVVRSIVIEG